jgi:serine/threonine-protein kinase
MDPSGAGTWAEHAPAGAIDESFAGRYRLSSLIGTGGMATVWRAEDEVLGRAVAVKVLHREYAVDQLARRRFRAEARAAASISHPNVVSVFDYGDALEGDGHERPFLVMEFIDGWSLAQEVAARGPLPAHEVGRIIEQVALGLSAAHALDVVHRDIKPGNLLVTPTRTMKITDFGIARAADSVSLTRTGAVVGTAQYIAPEQAAGQPAGPGSDIYSLGLVAYACLNGTPPFRAGTPLATALAHVRDPVPPLPAGTPVALRDLVMAMLAKSPGDRPPGAREVATLARDIVAGSSGDSKTVVPTGGSGPARRMPTEEIRPLSRTEVLAAGPEIGRRGWRPGGPTRLKAVALRHPVLPVLLILLVLLAAALSGVVLSGSAGPTESLPSVIGDPVATARAALQRDGLATTVRTADGPKAAGYVLAQTPGAGTRLGRGRAVALTVSSGFVQIGASGYTGRPAAVVLAELGALGLRPEESYVTGRSPYGQVLAVSPQGRVPLGSAVQVEVSAPPPSAPAPPGPAGDGKSGSGSGHHHPRSDN